MLYAENTMLPDSEATSKLLSEVPSVFNQIWVQLMNEVEPGQRIVMHNAYLLLPSDLLLSVIQAVKRGVHVNLLTNSPMSSDAGVVAESADFQYRELLNLNGSYPGSVTIFEYTTEEALHNKVSLIGDHYLVVGSANADPRSRYLDTQNGVFIKSSTLVNEYEQWLTTITTLLLDSGRLVLVTEESLDQEDEEPTITQRLLNAIRGVIEPWMNLAFDERVGGPARESLDNLFLQL